MDRHILTLQLYFDTEPGEIVDETERIEQESIVTRALEKYGYIVNQTSWTVEEIEMEEM